MNAFPCTLLCYLLPVQNWHERSATCKHSAAQGRSTAAANDGPCGRGGLGSSCPLTGLPCRRLPVPMQSSDHDFDLFILVRSYSPTFCLAEECTRRPVQAFTIHGLWPEYDNGAWPEYCNTSGGGSSSSSSGVQQAAVVAVGALLLEAPADARDQQQAALQQQAGPKEEQAVGGGEADLEAALAGGGLKGASAASLGKWRPHWHRKKKKKKRHLSPPPPPPPPPPSPQAGPPPEPPPDPAKQQQCEWPSFHGSGEVCS